MLVERSVYDRAVEVAVATAGETAVDVGGKPLIGWMIDVCKRARRVERCVVSTDDDEIAAVASDYGVDVVRRPAALSGDDCLVEEALLHALDELESRSGAPPDRFVLLQCTAPLTLAEDIAPLRRREAGALGTLPEALGPFAGETRASSLRRGLSLGRRDEGLTAAELALQVAQRFSLWRTHF